MTVIPLFLAFNRYCRHGARIAGGASSTAVVASNFDIEKSQIALVGERHGCYSLAPRYRR
jgi:hypothetical protein